EFFAGGGDDALLAQAKREKRVLVTRDVALLRRCPKAGVKCILLSSEKVEEQIAQIISEIGAELRFPKEMRCPECNGRLETAAAHSIKSEVPSHLLSEHEEFWKCAKCGKVYWEGSHWPNINKFYGRVVRLLEKAQKK
ncbi:MAG: Mut7-C RNAse domain-containing protein, partial [Candidatus Bilamarchaeaceae archaeon]